MELIGPPETCRISQHRLQGYLWNNAVGIALPDESAAICGRSCSYGIRPMGGLQAAWAI